VYNVWQASVPHSWHKCLCILLHASSTTDVWCVMCVMFVVCVMCVVCDVCGVCDVHSVMCVVCAGVCSPEKVLYTWRFQLLLSIVSIRTRHTFSSLTF